jgi:hypothetical protein
MEVLRKHKVRLYHNSSAGPDGFLATSAVNGGVHPTAAVNTQPFLDSAFPHSGSYATASVTEQQPQGFPGTSTQGIANTDASDFDSIWQEYLELGPHMDVPGWDSLFTDLDSTFSLQERPL